MAITETRHVSTGLSISKAGSTFTLNSTATVPVDLTLTLNLTFANVPSQNYFYVVKDTTTPSLNLAVDGSLSGTVAASLGILGVSAATTNTAFHAHLTATVNDPGGHGRLAFSEPASGGGTTPGALTQTNASSGQAPSTAGNNIIFGGFGNTSIEGGPGNDVIYGGSGNKDIDVVRDDAGAINKINNSGAPLPPLYPTINADPATFGIQGRTSYAARFPLPAGQHYDSDPGGFSHGGGVFHTTVYGDIIYGGTGRNVMQISDEGSRMIDESGNWNLWLVCHAQYGEPNIDRSHAPALKQFILDLASAGGVTDPNDPNSSGFAEVSWAAASHGSAYPGTPGHRHCEP